MRDHPAFSRFTPWDIHDRQSKSEPCGCDQREQHEQDVINRICDKRSFSDSAGNYSRLEAVDGKIQYMCDEHIVKAHFILVSFTANQVVSQQYPENDAAYYHRFYIEK